nr:immunoglobulin heavy chain junction region [Mus musculus]
CASNYAMDYW